MSSFTESPVIGQRWVMSLSQSNPLHHLLHRCQLIRWHAGATLFDLLCWTWRHFHKQTTESRRFKSPKISFTEAGVVLQHLPWAKRYFLTEERHHLADRKHIPSAHSGLFVNQVHGKDSEGAHKEKPASGVFKNAGILDLQLFLKQCSHNRKLQESFMVLNASWRRRHSTSDPRTVKTTAGTYKTAEKRCLTSTLGTGGWNRFYCSAAVKTSARYSASDTTYSCVSVISNLEGSQPRMRFLTFEFLLTQLSRCYISNTFLVFPAIPSIKAVHVLNKREEIFLNWSLFGPSGPPLTPCWWLW